MNTQLGNIAQIIQLSIAPVFLLAAVGTNLVVLTNRLGRIIDRTRSLEKTLDRHDAELMLELDELYKRSHLINRAITLSTSCSLLICLVIATLFASDAFGLELSKLVGSCFVMGILSLIGSLIYFLREIFVATKTLDRQRVQG